MKKNRSDPYRNFKFRIKWNGRTVAAFSKANALIHSTRAPAQDPNQSAYEAITLERGITYDPKFDHWANSIWEFKSSRGGVSLRDLRRAITIVQVNEAGQPVLAYNVFRCWVSEYQALPELDASANAVAIQSLTLENKGWEVDQNFREPEEPL